MSFNSCFCWCHLLSIATTSSVNCSVGVFAKPNFCKWKNVKCLITTPGFSSLSFGFAIFIFHCTLVWGGKEGGISCPWSDSRGGLCFICSLKIISMSQQKCVTECWEKQHDSRKTKYEPDVPYVTVHLFSIIKPWGMQGKYVVKKKIKFDFFLQGLGKAPNLYLTHTEELPLALNIVFTVL